MAKNKEQEEQKIEPIYFKLGPKQARWESPDESIKLSIFENIIYGNVDGKDPDLVRAIRNAFQKRTLTKVDKSEASAKHDKPELIDLTNVSEANAKLKREAIDILKKLSKADLMDKLGSIKNPYLIAQLIEQESEGNNKSKRRRDSVVDALKAKLEELGPGSTGFVSYKETTNEGYKLKAEKDEF